MKLTGQKITLALVLLAPFAGCRGNGAHAMADEQSLTGKDKAQALVAGYARHVEADDPVHQTLDDAGDRSFGTFGFKFQPAGNTLQMRVFIVRALDKEYPERMPQILKVRGALTDPNIGGHYETDAGSFVLNDAEQRLYLVKDLPISLSQPEFDKQADTFRAVGSRWFYSWFGHVAVQAFGKEPVPTGKVTLESDPYKPDAPGNGRDAGGVLLRKQ